MLFLLGLIKHVEFYLVVQACTVIFCDCDLNLQVVSEPMPWKGGLVGINSFGFGGSNVHVILQSPEAPEPEVLEKPTLPIVLPASGRTEESVKKILQFAREHNESKDLLSLLTEISSRPLNTFTHRGYAIIGSENVIEDVMKVQPNTRPIWYVFSGMGTQWSGMGEKLMQIPTFRESISKTAEILKEFKVDLVKIIMESDSNTYNNTINSFVGLASIQIALVDCLNTLGKFVCFLGCVHTWCPSTSTWPQAQNGAVFSHWVPDISLPSSVSEDKVKTLYLGMGTVPEFWRGYLKKKVYSY